MVEVGTEAVCHSQVWDVAEGDLGIQVSSLS